MKHSKKQIQNIVQPWLASSSRLSPASSKLSRGFTIIEVMIATALFIVIMVIGVGVLLNVSTSHKSTRIMRHAMDNMSFVMEDMARNIRLGTNIHCGSPGINMPDAETGVSCPSPSPTPGGTGVQASLILGMEGYLGISPEPEDQIFYWFVTDANGVGYIQKSRDGDVGSSYKRITPTDIDIDLTRSGFSVYGAASDGAQTRVIIRVVGTVQYQNVSVPFNIQTTVTPRNIDS